MRACRLIGLSCVPRFNAFHLTTLLPRIVHGTVRWRPRHGGFPALVISRVVNDAAIVSPARPSFGARRAAWKVDCSKAIAAAVIYAWSFSFRLIVPSAAIWIVLIVSRDQ